MFVGQTGVGRVIERTCQVMKEHPGADVKQYGAIPMEIIQRYINFWSASSTDLFGAEVSSNSANFFGAGLKGRAYEDRYEEHTGLGQEYALERFEGGKLVPEKIALLNAMNEVLRDEYVKDNEKGIEYWNRVCERYENPFRFTLPHRRFNRKIGDYAAGRFDLEGNPIDERTWEKNVAQWLPSAEYKAYVKSLMVPCHERGKIAGWVAPPPKGVDNQSFDYEYVKL
jgi:benzoyl-CoA 2,3-dioxygenase component B